MQPEFEYIARFGSLFGLLVYIFVKEFIPFFKDRLWPSVENQKKETNILRRETDAKRMDLEERKIVAEEQVAKTLILLSERVKRTEEETQLHDQRMLTAFGQLTATQTAMQTILNVLLDRIYRPPTLGE
jgi:valyl-tRNA synthetase